MKKYFLSIALLLVCALVGAQGTVDNYLLRSVVVKNPILTDTVNAKGEVYKGSDLLKTPMEIGFDKGDISTASSDTAGYISLAKADKNSLIHLVGFNAYADRYAKATLDVSSNTLMEVYIDGKKVKSSTPCDSIATLTVEYTFEPMHVYNVVIKMLSQSTDKAAPTVKCEIVSKDSSVNIYNTIDNKRFYELSDNFIGRRLAGVSISPDGKYLLTTYSTRYDTKSPSYNKVLTEVKSGMVIAPRMSSKAKWMPRSSKLYYTEKALNGYDVLSFCPATMQEEVLLSGISSESFIWSPAEDYLIITVKESAKKNVGPMKYHASQYDRVDGRGRTLLAKYDIRTGVTERLTFGNLSSALNDISLDGKKLLFTTFVTDYSHREAVRKSLYEVDMETFAIDTILKDQWFLDQAAYSPDGGDLLLMAGPEAFDKIGMNCGEHKTPNNYDTQAFIMSRESGKIRPITKDFDPKVSVITWNAGTNTIYFGAEDKMYKNIYAYSVKDNTWSKVDAKPNVVRSFSIDNEGVNAAYFGVGTTHSSRAYTYDVKRGKSTLYADPMEPVYKDLVFGEEEDFVFKTEDGTEIDGYVCFPPNYDASKKYPLIVYYYGGTSPSQKWNEYYYGAHLFASRGYMVYIVNPSGTTGYGQEFSARHVNAWGIRTADEIIEGTKLVCNKYPSIDSNKMGCIGASYGGFMTQYILTKTDIFAGAVSHAGISNLASYWGEGNWGVGYSYVASADSYPWNNAKLYTEQGSIFNADKINTPILLVQGSEDTNVPLGESVQLYNALKRLGRTVEFIEVEGENHTIVESLDKQILWHNTIMAWFAKTLQDSPEWWDAMYPKIYTE